MLLQIIGSTAHAYCDCIGSAITVLGTVSMSNSSTGVTDPSWRCFLDGKEGVIPNPTTASFNNWSVCDFNATEVSDGKHTLSIQVTSSSRNFWLDYIDYTPSPSLPPTTQNSYITLSNKDPAIVYDSSWSLLYDACDVTTATGSTMTMNFNGTGLDWYGMIPTEMNHGSSSCTYSVNGEAPTPFTLQGIDGVNDPSQYNQRFFSSPDRPYGAHSITVTYLGSRTPLTLTHLVVRDSSASRLGAPASTTANSAPTPSSPDSQSSASSGLKSGAIAGIVVGAMIAVGLIIAGIIFGRRRRQKHSRPPAIDQDPYPSYFATEGPGTITSFPYTVKPAQSYEHPQPHPYQAPQSMPPVSMAYASHIPQDGAQPVGGDQRVIRSNTTTSRALPPYSPTTSTYTALPPYTLTSTDGSS